MSNLNSPTGAISTPPDTVAGIVAEGRGNRGYRRLTLAMILIACLLILGALLAPLIPRSLQFQASEIVRLPPDATVLAVHFYGGRNCGDVSFTIPEPKGPGTRLDRIWTDAGMMSPASSSFSSLSLSPGGVAPRGVTLTSVSARGSGRAGVTLKVVPKTALPGRRPSAKRSTAAAASMPAYSSGSLHWYGVRRVKDGLTCDDGVAISSLRYVPSLHCYHFRRLPSRHPDED